MQEHGPEPLAGESWEVRELHFKGRDEPVHAWRLRLESPAAT